MKDFGLGVFIGITSCLAVVSSALLAFVLFCPIWQEWTNDKPETKPPVVNVFPDIRIEAPKVPRNFPNEFGGKLPNILPKPE